MQTPKACLFDLDGLLLDTEPLHGQAWLRTAEIFGKSLTQEQLLTLRGRRRIDCALQIIKWIDKDIQLEELLKVHQPISKSLVCEAKAMPGAEELIRYCNEIKIPMALVTSSSSEAVAFKSSPHPWLKLINIKVMGDDPTLKKGKPAPDPYLLAAKRLDVITINCWAFEDSKSGTESALGAGCKVWVLNQNPSNLNTYENIKKSSNPTLINSLDFITKKLKTTN